MRNTGRNSTSCLLKKIKNIKILKGYIQIKSKKCYKYGWINFYTVQYILSDRKLLTFSICDHSEHCNIVTSSNTSVLVDCFRCVTWKFWWIIRIINTKTLHRIQNHFQSSTKNNECKYDRGDNTIIEYNIWL